MELQADAFYRLLHIKLSADYVIVRAPTYTISIMKPAAAPIPWDWMRR